MRGGKRLAGLLAGVLLLCLCMGGCAREEELQPEQTAEPEAEREAMIVSDLEGDWYGYWEAFNCSGPWAELQDRKWDCCAEIDGEERLLLWDEDVEKDTGLAAFEILNDGEELRLSGLRFMEIQEGWENWTLRLKPDEYGDMLVLRGRYEAKNGGSFSFAVYLRPWESLWPEEEDRRPDGYESFYLPLTESGKGMPDSFD